MHSNTPFADPLWLTRGLSPYYTDSHRRLQAEVRTYVDTHITPHCDEWEAKGAVPQEVTSRHNSRSDETPCLIFHLLIRSTKDMLS